MEESLKTHQPFAVGGFLYKMQEEEKKVNQKHQVSQINESLSIRSGIITTLVLAFTNNYFSLFAISVLSATNYQVGLISSLLQFIGMFGSLLAAWVVSRLERKKTVVGLATLMTRLFLIPMALVVYLSLVEWNHDKDHI
ncbi:MFS transporter, partial [Bacillaceae bacterium S4-13-58]